MFFDAAIPILFLVAVYVINYKPKLNDKTLMINYLTLNGKRGSKVYEASTHADLY